MGEPPFDPRFERDAAQQAAAKMRNASVLNKIEEEKQEGKEERNK